jgi:hypothetical protein
VSLTIGMLLQLLFHRCCVSHYRNVVATFCVVTLTVVATLASPLLRLSLQDHFCNSCLTFFVTLTIGPLL